MKFILASKSPRRKEILENLGISFEIVTADTNEDSEITDPAELVRELSVRKGRAVAEKIIEDNKIVEKALVISSDTVVASDGEILGKPCDENDAKRMLRGLSGRAHSVFSGIAITEIEGGRIIKTAAATEETRVYFSGMSEEDIDFYVHAEQVYDKAGAYAIQGIASAYIEKIDGDYFNVVGLPVRRMFKLLEEEYGIKLRFISDIPTSSE